MTPVSNNKVAAIALAAALLGGTVGAFAVRSIDSPAAANVAPRTEATLGTNATIPASMTNSLVPQPAMQDENQLPEPALYQEPAPMVYRESARQPVYREQAPQVYREPVRTRAAHRPRAERAARSESATVYEQPRKRSGWEKHRDILTVGMGAGAGALIGGLAGGRKGTAIGAAAGAGAAALYTYKIRKKEPRY